MPRATRAALRAQELAEEAASVALPPTPTRERVPLGEISHNTGAKIIMRLEEDPSKQPEGKAKKTKGGKKGKKGKKAKPEDDSNEVLEDENASNPSDAAEEASNNLINAVTSDATVIPDRASTPPSPAVELATQHLENVSLAEDQSATMHEGLDQQTHPLVADLQQTTASNPVHADAIPANVDEVAKAGSQDDSFVEQIKTRSPAKRVSRIEDSVEALDQLEDEIEKVGQAIPAAASDKSSPADARKSARKTKTKTAVEKNSKQASKASTPRPEVASAKNVKTKPATSNTATRSGAAVRNDRLKNVAAPSPSRHSGVQRSAPSPPKSQALPPRRVSSIHKAPFQPVKSTKPTTKSTFELPGEAVARKLKEQREERQKREEEAQAKKASSKARPSRPSQVPEVKMTATARARLSLAQQPLKENSRPTKPPGKVLGASIQPQSGSRTNPGPPTQPPKRKIPSSPNISVKREPSLGAGTTTRPPFSSSIGRSGPSADQIASQKTRGKEVFGRHRTLLSEKELEKKAKEEAAKKARIEAAERGRLASREWAEKQKARKLAAQKAKPAEQQEA